MLAGLELRRHHSRFCTDSAYRRCPLPAHSCSTVFRSLMIVGAGGWVSRTVKWRQRKRSATAKGCQGNTRRLCRRWLAKARLLSLTGLFTDAGIIAY